MSTNRSVFIEFMYFMGIDRLEKNPQYVFPMVRPKPAEITAGHNANDQQKQYQPGYKHQKAALCHLPVTDG